VPKPKNTKLSVFKGREARLNHVIFQILSLKGPQTIYDIHKQIRTLRALRSTRYEVINRRVKALESSCFIRRLGSRKTRAGFETIIYDLTTKAYLAMLLDCVSLEDLAMRANNDIASELLAIIVQDIWG